MQSQDANTRSAGAVNHPSAEEWMAYLYDEVAPERKRELHAHLAQCGDCGRQLHQWRAGMVALDEWKLPPIKHTRSVPQPVALARWAVAAVLVLAVGFAIGRQTASAARELSALKATVAQLTERVEGRGFDASNTVAVATTAANAEALRLLSDYAQLDDARRTQDRQTVGLVLREMDSRLLKLRTELETVAVNTETGFRQTKEGLTTLASYTVADRGDASDFTKPESKNQ
jgi:hypothetical protein